MLIKIFSHYRLIFRGVLNVLIMSTEQGGWLLVYKTINNFDMLYGPK
jgi:hypothetical protein